MLVQENSQAYLIGKEYLFSFGGETERADSGIIKTINIRYRKPPASGHL